MASKTIHLPEIGDVVISKRKGQQSIRVTVSGNVAKVTQPAWLPFSAGEKFALSRAGWIKDNLKTRVIRAEGDQLSRSRRLHFLRTSLTKISSRVASDTLTILLPANIYPEDQVVQDYIAKKLPETLRRDAEDYLPHRVSQLAEMFGFTYKSVQVKLLKRRWGSCNSKKELVFNLRLMALDQLHIDYVILHELTHTVHMNHGAEFWAHMESVMPGSRKIAKQVRYADAS